MENLIFKDDQPDRFQPGEHVIVSRFVGGREKDSLYRVVEIELSDRKGLPYDVRMERVH